MPTLLEVPLMDEADASRMSTSMESNQHAAGSETEQQTFVNDSTRLLDETMLENTRTSTPGSHRYYEKNVCPTEERDDATMDNDETRLGDMTFLDNDVNTRRGEQRTNRDTITLFDYEKPRPAVRTIGPNQDHYLRNFERYVSHVIADFQRHHPEQLKDYRSMSASDKQREMQRINTLLSRLGASTTTTLQHCRARIDEGSAGVALAESSGDSSATRLSSDHSRSSLEQSHGVNGHQESASSATLFCGEQHDDADMQERNLSSTLLSSESEVDELAARMNESMVMQSPTTSHAKAPQTPQDSDSSASSVELVRRNKSRPSSPYSNLYEYESPAITTNRSKRLASTSGKRGTDMSRMKIDDDSFVSFDASVPRGSERISSPSQLLCSSIKSPESPLFHASQSPIPEDFSSAEKNHVTSQPSRLEVFEDQQSANDTLQSHDITTNYRRKVKWNDESFLQEIPANVRLKEGAAFRMKPLRVGRPELRDESTRRRRISLVDIPDPLSLYEGALRKKIKAAYAWMKARDAECDDVDVNGGVLFSMDKRNIIDVTMRLCIRHPSDHGDMIDEVLRGGTLIVVRDKEDLTEWQSSLREGTSFSVINHATLVVQERKRVTTANRCAGYDVVVTTFDALKSKDVTTSLDEQGHAVHGKVGFQDGWYLARSSGSESQGRCEQLSVLHQVSWRRVVFVDGLGRKCFLAKMDTARAVAAVALCASSRFLFFPDEVVDSKITPVAALAKSDKNAFKSVAKVLHLHEEAAVGGLSNSMFDMNDVATSKYAARACRRTERY